MRWKKQRRCTGRCYGLNSDRRSQLHSSGIKTLFDGLRMPTVEEGRAEKADLDPLFCLLEDDALITDVVIRTDRLNLFSFTGTFRGKPRRNGRACGRQYLCSAICATRSKAPAIPRCGTGAISTSGLPPPRTLEIPVKQPPTALRNKEVVRPPQHIRAESLA
jgi:hypothetical protein